MISGRWNLLLETRAEGTGRRLVLLLREDREIYRGREYRSAFPAIALQRIGHAAMNSAEPAGFPLRLARKGLRGLAFLVRTASGIELSWHADIGRRVVFAHQGGIVVGAWARIGDDCLVRQNVTIGAGQGGRRLAPDRQPGGDRRGSGDRGKRHDR